MGRGGGLGGIGFGCRNRGGVVVCFGEGEMVDVLNSNGDDPIVVQHTDEGFGVHRMRRDAERMERDRSRSCRWWTARMGWSLLLPDGRCRRGSRGGWWNQRHHHHQYMCQYREVVAIGDFRVDRSHGPGCPGRLESTLVFGYRIACSADYCGETGTSHDPLIQELGGRRR